MKIRVENTKGRKHTRLYKLKEKIIYKTLIEKENTNRKFRDRNTIGPLDTNTLLTLLGCNNKYRG